MSSYLYRNQEQELPVQGDKNGERGGRPTRKASKSKNEMSLGLLISFSITIWPQRSSDMEKEGQESQYKWAQNKDACYKSNPTRMYIINKHYQNPLKV